MNLQLETVGQKDSAASGWNCSLGRALGNLGGDRRSVPNGPHAIPGGGSYSSGRLVLKAYADYRPAPRCVQFSQSEHAPGSPVPSPPRNCTCRNCSSARRLRGFDRRDLKRLAMQSGGLHRDAREGHEATASRHADIEKAYLNSQSGVFSKWSTIKTLIGTFVESSFKPSCS